MVTDKGFQLDGSPLKPDFELESEASDSFSAPVEEQVELFFPRNDAEKPEPVPQLELNGLAKLVHGVAVWTEGSDAVLTRAQFQHANSLLESLEAQNVEVPYQCREGYCGGCRTQLLSGEVAYLQEPMAWLNKGEILPCCCVPKTDLVLKLKG